MRKFVKNILVDFEDYVIEGAVISPAMADKLSDKFPIRAIFLGNSSAEVDSLLVHIGNNKWLRNAPAGELVNIPVGIRRRSLEVEAECQRLDYPYIDLAGDFDDGMERAFALLMGEK